MSRQAVFSDLIVECDRPNQSMKHYYGKQAAYYLYLLDVDCDLLTNYSYRIRQLQQDRPNKDSPRQEGYREGVGQGPEAERK